MRVFDPAATSGMVSGRLPVNTSSPASRVSSSSQYSTQTEYNQDIKDGSGVVVVPAGTRVTKQTTPVAEVVMPDGSPLTVRRTTSTTYDVGAPNNNVNPATGKPYGLATTVVTTLDSDRPGTGVEVARTVNSYTPVVAGDGDGWALGSPVKVTTNGSSSTTRFDTAGRVVETRDPSATAANTSASPQATATIYYTAGTNTRDASCGGTTASAAWAGSVCVVKPGAAPSAGPVLVTKKSTYDKWLGVATLTETAASAPGSASRTTTTRVRRPSQRILLI